MNVPDRLAPLFVIFAASLWGIDGIILRPSLYGLPVPLVVLVESSIVVILLTPFFIRKYPEIKSLNYRDWLAFIGIALFGGAIGTMAITKALFYVNFVNLSIVVLIQKLQPVFAFILASLLLQERLPFRFFAWSSVAIFGAYLMTFGFTLPNMNTGAQTISAALFALLAAFSFGTSTVLSKRALRNVSFQMGTYLRFLVTTIIMIIIVTSFRLLFELNKITSKQLMVFLLIAFSTGGLATFFYYYGLKKISASLSATCELAFPLTAVVLEYLVRGNILGIVQWGGVFLLLISIFKVMNLKL